MAEEKNASKEEAAAEEEIKNAVTIEEAGPCKKKITVEIPEETVLKATNEQYRTLGKDAEVPGFRKGRAPRRLLERRFGKEVSQQIKLKLLADASDAAVKDNEIDTLRDPDIDHEKIELPEKGTLKFEFEVEVRPEFDLPELENIPLNKTAFEVNDEQVASEIEMLRKYSGMWAPRKKGEKVEENDQVIGDVLLKVEGVEENEKIDNTEIFVRAGGFVGSVPVEELDKLLIGATAGDVKETSVDVPATFHNEAYRGKKVDITIEVKDVKWLKPAELDEAFFKNYGTENEAELKEKIEESLNARLEQDAKAEMTEQVYKYMIEKTDFDLPTSIIAEQAQSLMQRQYSTVLQKGLPAEQLKEEIEKIQSTSEDQAREQLKTFFILSKIAEKFEIEVTEEEINGQIAQIAIGRGQRPEKMKEDMLRDGTLAQFSMQLRESKCIDKLLETAKITEVAPEKAEKKKAVKVAKKTPKKTAKAKDDLKEAPKETPKKAVKKAAKKTTKKTDEKTAEKKTVKKSTKKKTDK